MEGKVKDSDWRLTFFYEYFYERNFATPTITAIRSGDSKLIKYPGHEKWTEMFNLGADRYELHNLANDPKHQAERYDIESELRNQEAALHYRVPESADKLDPAHPGHF